MGEFVESFKGKYITAEDMNIGIADLEIVREKTRHVTGLSRESGSSGNPSPYTARGVVQGMRAVLEEVWGSPSFQGRRILIQGVGAVGGRLAELLAEKGAEVVCYTADVGQGEESELARQKALATGAVEAVVEDLREEFVRDAVFPALRASAVYEWYYLLGTSLARPIITRGLMRTVKATGADAIAHGATGKGNDQVRFELSAFALDPEIRIIAPWREWKLRGRADLVSYAAARGIPVATGRFGAMMAASRSTGSSIRCRRQRAPTGPGKVKPMSSWPCSTTSAKHWAATTIRISQRQS